MFTKIKYLISLLFLTLILAACQSSATTETPEPIVETVVVTEVVKATPVEVIHVVTPTPEPIGPRTLVICLGQEPETLAPYHAGTAGRHILEASSERTWGLDTNSFAYQPVILKKLPSLADGDAALTAVTVREGDLVVDVEGEVVTLDSAADQPLMLIPAGGGDPLPYLGGDFQMDQLSATFTMLANLEWSDGTPLTSADSVYAYDFLGGDESVASYTAVDEVTTQWTGLPGFMEFGYLTRFYGPMPEHIWSKYPPEEVETAE